MYFVSLYKNPFSPPIIIVVVPDRTMARPPSVAVARCRALCLGIVALGPLVAVLQDHDAATAVVTWVNDHVCGSTPDEAVDLDLTGGADPATVSTLALYRVGRTGPVLDDRLVPSYGVEPAAAAAATTPSSSSYSFYYIDGMAVPASDATGTPWALTRSNALWAHWDGFTVDGQGIQLWRGRPTVAAAAASVPCTVDTGPTCTWDATVGTVPVQIHLFHTGRTTYVPRVLLPEARAKGTLTWTMADGDPVSTITVEGPFAAHPGPETPLAVYVGIETARRSGTWSFALASDPVQAWYTARDPTTTVRTDETWTAAVTVGVLVMTVAAVRAATDPAWSPGWGLVGYVLVAILVGSHGSNSSSSSSTDPPLVPWYHGVASLVGAGVTGWAAATATTATTNRFPGIALYGFLDALWVMMLYLHEGTPNAAATFVAAAWTVQVGNHLCPCCAGTWDGPVARGGACLVFGGALAVFAWGAAAPYWDRHGRAVYGLSACAGPVWATLAAVVEISTHMAHTRAVQRQRAVARKEKV